MEALRWDLRQLSRQPEVLLPPPRQAQHLGPAVPPRGPAVPPRGPAVPPRHGTTSNVEAERRAAPFTKTVFLASSLVQCHSPSFFLADGAPRTGFAAILH